MSKFRSYNAYNTNFNDISVERRTGDKIAEVNRNVNDIHSDILRLNIMCQAREFNYLLDISPARSS